MFNKIMIPDVTPIFNRILFQRVSQFGEFVQLCFHFLPFLDIFARLRYPFGRGVML